MVIFWRSVFLLLLLVNLLVFAWSQEYFGRLDDGREPLRVGRQLDPEKLRISPLTAEEAAERLKPPPVVQACRLIKELSPDEAQKLMDRAQAELGLKDLKFTRVVEEAGSARWVHIPALPDKATTERKMQEIRQRGITDAALMRDDSTGRFAISLGVFSTPEAASVRLQDLTRHGIRSAIISAHPRAMSKARITVRGPQPLLAGPLPALLETLNLTEKPQEDCPNP